MSKGFKRQSYNFKKLRLLDNLITSQTLNDMETALSQVEFYAETLMNNIENLKIRYEELDEYLLDDYLPRIEDTFIELEDIIILLLKKYLNDTVSLGERSRFIKLQKDVQKNFNEILKGVKHHGKKKKSITTSK